MYESKKLIVSLFILLFDSFEIFIFPKENLCLDIHFIRFFRSMSIKQSLCIGINAYVPRHLRLKPCIYDARDLSDSLNSIGFETHCESDLDLSSMKYVVKKFTHSIQRDAIVLFYFSGHGVQHEGNNYLIPADARGISAHNIHSTAIDAQKLIEDMYKKRPKLIIFILDCCRTEPPTTPIDGGFLGDIFRGLLGGLAPMRGPPSTIIAYACAANDVASSQSRNGRNSLYTYHLLNYITTPNVDVESALKYAAMGVQEESRNRQIPFRYSSCNEMIYLAENRRRHSVPSPRIRRARSYVGERFLFIYIYIRQRQINIRYVYLGLLDVPQQEDFHYGYPQPLSDEIQNPRNRQYGIFLNYNLLPKSPSYVIRAPWQYGTQLQPGYWNFPW